MTMIDTLGKPAIRRTPVFAVVALALSAGGCANQIADFNRQPALSAVGSGLLADRVPLPAEPSPQPTYRPGNSLWQDASADLFRDPRARKIGDVVTVKISIKDKASLDNTSNRVRNSNRTLGLAGTYGLETSATKTEGQGDFDASINSKTSSKGEGAITRSESIELLVAAVVSDVLPNGNLVISGTQEVRVNYEVRVLSVAGVVRPSQTRLIPAGKRSPSPARLLHVFT